MSDTSIQSRDAPRIGHEDEVDTLERLGDRRHKPFRKILDERGHAQDVADGAGELKVLLSAVIVVEQDGRGRPTPPIVEG